MMLSLVIGISNAAVLPSQPLPQPVYKAEQFNEFVGINGAQGKFTAHLSDSSAPDYVSTALNGNLAFDWALAPHIISDQRRNFAGE